MQALKTIVIALILSTFLVINIKGIYISPSYTCLQASLWYVKSFYWCNKDLIKYTNVQTLLDQGVDTLPAKSSRK